MKLDQKPVEITHQIPSSQTPSYFVWEQHNVTLIRSNHYGYGVAISGGCNDPKSSQDPSIYVSDIVGGGPAQHKLFVNDKLLSVNGVSVENVEHSFAIRLLKEAKEFIHLVVKRKINDSNEHCMKNKNNEQQIQDLKAKEAEANSGLSTIRRCNQAILQTANTLLANFNAPEVAKEITKTATVPLLKPIKVTLNRKDKRDGFGLILGCKFYIKDILPDTLASNEANLQKGDILLKLNDLGTDQLSLAEANKMLVKSNKLQLAVKRNSLASVDSAESECSDDVQSSCGDTKQESEAKNERQQIISVSPPDQTGEDCSDNGQTHQLSAKQLFKPIDNDINRSSKFNMNSKPEKALNCRTVRFARENGIGIRLAGGNKVGIFICDVQYGSPAERAGLKIADKIIRVNGTDYTHLTREEAVHHILLIQHQIEMQVALSQSDYEAHAFDPLGGDSFYVRAHFNYTSTNPVDLSFKINDVLHVTDTLYNGVMGQWVATKLSAEQQKQPERGTVPNQVSAEQLVTTADTIDAMAHAADTVANPITSNLHAIGASARMSIRKKLGKGGLAKRSKSASRSAANSDTEGPPPEPFTRQKQADNVSKAKVSKANTFAGSKYPAYERVVLKEVNFTRPVVIFGALSDVARERLRQELPNNFEIPDSYSNEGASGVIKLASIKGIIDAGKHCLLDITPNAVEHLNYAQYFPICVFLRAEGYAHVKELRHKYAKTLKPKSSKRLYESAARLASFYSHLFTTQVALDASGWMKKLKDTIESQQKQPLWISQELDELLSTTSPNPQNPQDQSSDYDLSLQQQKFIAKQTQILKSNNHQQHQHQTSQPSRYNMLDDNFELPLNTLQHFSTISGAASTYSLYEDQNYRSSFAASDSDIGVSNPVASSSIIRQPVNNEQNQPIYSTNFNNTSGRMSNYMQQVEEPSPPRFKSESNLGNYEATQNETATQLGTKFATYNPNQDSKNAFIQKTDRSHSSQVNYEHNQDLANYRRLSATSDYVLLQQQQQNQPPQLPIQPPRNRNFAGNNSNGYKLIKSSGSQLMPSMESGIIDHSMHYAELNQNQLSQSSLLQAANQQASQESETSLVEKLNLLKMGESITQTNNDRTLHRQQSQTDTAEPTTKYHQPQLQQRTKKDAPSKPPPPTLPKPKFHLPQSSVTNLVLQRNLKAKSELNIATPHGYLSSSASSGASSTSSSKDIICQTSPPNHKTPIDVHHLIPAGITKQARNKLLENNSLVTNSSQGYHSDTWESSHSSRQSLELEKQLKIQEPQQLPPSRYKQFSKASSSSKIIGDQKQTNLPSGKHGTDTAGSTSDGSLNGISGDDTDSIPQHDYNKVKSSSSAASTSSNSSTSCSSTSSAAAISGATTLSSNSSNSFTAAMQQVIKNGGGVNGLESIQDSPGRQAAIELPIFYQTSEMTNGKMTEAVTQTPSHMNNYVKSPTKNAGSPNNSNNSYTDLYSSTNEALKYSRPSTSTYTAHYNDNGIYRKLSLDSNSNCSIIASANGIFDANGGILESADTGVSINVPEGAIASGYSFDLYFKVCHCKSNITNGKGELLTNPIVMCGPRGVKFLKPIELQIPHFISIDGQSWSYAFKTCDLDDSFNFSRFQKKTLINSVTVSIDGF